MRERMGAPESNTEVVLGALIEAQGWTPGGGLVRYTGPCTREVGD